MGTKSARCSLTARKRERGSKPDHLAPELPRCHGRPAANPSCCLQTPYAPSTRKPLICQTKHCVWFPREIRVFVLEKIPHPSNSEAARSIQQELSCFLCSQFSEACSRHILHLPRARTRHRARRVSASLNSVSSVPGLPCPCATGRGAGTLHPLLRQRGVCLARSTPAISVSLPMPISGGNGRMSRVGIWNESLQLLKLLVLGMYSNPHRHALEGWKALSSGTHVISAVLYANGSVDVSLL